MAGFVSEVLRRTFHPVWAVCAFAVVSFPALAQDFPLNINSGGPAYIGHGWVTWVSDSYYVGGTTNSITGPIANTSDQPAYRSERLGNFTYTIPNIPNGSYTVTLKFAEFFWTSPGQRVFDVSINNQPVLTKFDIIKDIGSANAADDRTFSINVTTNLLKIAFTSVVDQAQVNGISIAFNGAASKAPSPTVLSSCGQISASGSYVLGNNLVSSPNAICLYIHDTTNVQLDCREFSITSLTNSALSLHNVSNYSISNCDLISGTSIGIINSPSGTLTGNTITGIDGITAVGDGMEIASNSMNGPLTVIGNAASIENNTITLSGKKSYSGVIYLDSSTGSLIQDNVLAGGWDGTSGPLNYLGADDGISLVSVTNSTLQNNTISSVWGCGIENTGFMGNTQILNNTITDAYQCGIGGWYWNSLKGNTISGNTVTRSNFLFVYERFGALLPGEQYVYFQDNTFRNNTFLQPNGFFTTWIDLLTSPSGGVPDNAFALGNNMFVENNFNLGAAAPYFNRGSMVVDGGGNVCGTVLLQSDFPLRCGVAPVITSFTATPAAYPGQSVTLAWKVSGATSVKIDHGVGDVSNVSSVMVAPPQTTTYTLTASNNGVSSVAQVTVSTNPLTIAILDPSAKSVVSGSLIIRTQTVDTVGFVFTTQIKIDDTPLPYSSRTAPWNTTQVANGPHTITATATDNLGNQATARINVIVQN